MILDGLYFAEYFDKEIDSNDPCLEPIFAIMQFFKVVFTFSQLYFVFVNSKVCLFEK